MGIFSGLVWFSIPFTLATTMGLAYLGLSSAQGAPMLTEEDVMKGEETVRTIILRSLFLSVRSCSSLGGSEVAWHDWGVRHPLPHPHGRHVNWLRRGDRCGLHRDLRRVPGLHMSLQTWPQGWAMYFVWAELQRRGGGEGGHV